MTSREFLHEIVAAEMKARGIYGEAIKRQEGYEEYINGTKTRLHDELFERAQKRLEQYEAEETARADAEIARLDEKLERDLSAISTNFEGNRQSLADRMFDMVVGLDE